MVTFLAVPGQIDASSRIGDASAAEPSADWKTLFAEAGLSDRQFSAVSPQSIPPVFADTRAAWNGAYPERPNVPIRIEAAANQAKPVFFDIVAPWSAPRNEERQFGTTSGERTGLVMRMVVSPLLILVATILAVRNLRLGRGDRRGATRLSMFLFAAGAISNALETGNLLVLTTRAPVLVLFVPGFAWLLYIALEPHVRRVWPETMIAWSRLLAGGLRDPLVGRDVLVGVLLAIGNALVLALHTTLRRWSGRPPQFPTGADGNPFDGMAASSDLLLGGRYALSRIIGSVMSIPAWGTVMSTFLVLLVLYALLRRRWLAIAALTLGLTVIFVAVHGGWLLGNAPADHFAPSLVDVGVFAATQAAIVVVAVRFGLLTMLIASFVSTLLNLVPIAVDASAPYASSSWMIVATVIALAISGWRTALDGRPMFGALFRVE
jgi:hypothetical protein